MKWLRDRINLLALLAISAWVSLPILFVKLRFAIIVGLFLVWFITTNLTWLFKNWVKLFLLGLWFMVLIIYRVCNGELWFGSNEFIITSSLFLIFSLVFDYYIITSKTEALKYICLVSIIFYAVGSITTTIFLQQFPLAARLLATGIDDVGRFKELGIGGYDYIYSAIFLIPGLLYLISARKSSHHWMIKKIIPIICLVSVLLLVWNASYAIALILTIIYIIFTFIFKPRPANYIILFLCLLFFLVLPKEWLGTLLVNIAVHIQNDTISGKISDLAVSFLGNGMGIQTVTRVALYLKSWGAFLSHPIVGSYGAESGRASLSLGGHSGWLDLLGGFGLMGLPIIGYIYKTFTRANNLWKGSSFQSVLILSWMVFVVFGFINPFFQVYNIGFIMFLIVPAIPFVIENTKVTLKI